MSKSPFKNSARCGVDFRREPDRPPAAEGPNENDVAEYPLAFDHVGLLVNEPPGTAELLFI